MKKLLFTTLMLSAMQGLLFAQPASSDVAVLAYSADQLAARFAGKNRKEVLSAITTVPVYERTFSAPDGTEYQAIRYGKINQDYRLFLFQFKWPQPLVSVVENAKGILALNEKYNINIPLEEKDLSARGAKKMLTTVQDVANQAEYNIYQDGGEFLVFQNGLLVHTFDTAEQYSAFMATLTASNAAYSAKQAEQQTALEKARLQQQSVQNAQVRRYYYNPLWETAVVGGIVLGTAYPWRHYSSRHHHHRQPGYLPPLKPSGPPPGTVLIRDVNGKYMNRHH